MAPKLPDLLDELINGPESKMGNTTIWGQKTLHPINKYTGRTPLTQWEIEDIKNSEHYYVCKKCMGDGRDPVMTGFCRCKACDGQGLFSWIDIPLLRHEIELIEVVNGVFKICEK